MIIFAESRLFHNHHSLLLSIQPAKRIGWRIVEPPTIPHIVAPRSSTALQPPPWLPDRVRIFPLPSSKSNANLLPLDLPPQGGYGPIMFRVPIPPRTPTFPAKPTTTKLPLAPATAPRAQSTLCIKLTPRPAQPPLPRHHPKTRNHLDVQHHHVQRVPHVRGSPREARALARKDVGEDPSYADVAGGGGS